jgi:hypothetical protein
MGYFSPSSQFIQQYIYERRGDPGYNDEKAHEVLWNYLLRTSDSDDPDGKKVRDAVRNKEWDTVETELDNLIDKIKTDTDHPLHFDNLEYGDGFTGNPAGTARADKGQKTAAHKAPYEERIDRGKSGILSMLKSRQGNSMGSKGWTVTAQGGETEESKSGWVGNPKGQGRTDLVYQDPTDEKKQHRQSQKDTRGSVAYSAGGGQTKAMIDAGAEEITKLKFDKPRKEKNEDGEIESDAEYKERLTKIKLDKRKEGEEKRQEIGRETTEIQRELDSTRGQSAPEQQSTVRSASDREERLYQQNPGLKRAKDQEALTGKRQFGSKVDSVITTGDERSSVKDPRGVNVSSRMRAGKGGGRPAVSAGDIRPEPVRTAPERPEGVGFRDFMRTIANRNGNLPGGGVRPYMDRNSTTKDNRRG